MTTLAVLTPTALHLKLTTLFQQFNDAVTELEILPSSYPVPNPEQPIQYDGSALAIRQRDLAAAAVVARHRFFAMGIARLNAPAYSNAEQLLDATVLLFFAPEYLAAANWRKRYLLQQHAFDDNAFRCERLWLDGLLTSPLPKHTKSPTLWQHRYWIMQNWPVTSALAPRPTFPDELAIVLQAADRHFANYTAFDYARRIYTLLIVSDFYSNADQGKKSAKVETAVDASRLVLSWCLAHPRDVSGWAFLAFLLHRISRDAAVVELISNVKQFVLDTGCKFRVIIAFLEEFQERSSQGK